MDNKTFYDDSLEPKNIDYTEVSNSFGKVNLALIRILSCAIILLTLALLKHFNYTNYQQIGVWYSNKFKTESINTATIKDFVSDKYSVLREKIKCKINNL